MAKVVLPLLSAEARGKIADSLVFFPLAHAKGGQPVRRWLTPQNPQSEDQGDARIKTAAAGNVITCITYYSAKKATADKDLSTQLKAATPAKNIWNAYYVQRMLGSAFAVINQALSDYADSTEASTADFITSAAALAMEDTVLSYSAIGTITAGEKLFVAAHAAYLMGLACAPADAVDMTPAEIVAFAKAFTDVEV